MDSAPDNDISTYSSICYRLGVGKKEISGCRAKMDYGQNGSDTGVVE